MSMLGVNKLNGDPSRRRYGQIGIPLSEVSKRLTALHECLLEHGMAIKSQTGVHIDCASSSEPVALGLTLEVVLMSTEQEEGENG